jgi:DNA-binding transcriptional regulator YhcF (GntR family)
VPKYIQISDSIIRRIKNGDLSKGSKLPSINQICTDNQLAKETVVKAFNRLKEKGLIDSVHGKGFYVSSTNTQTIDRIFILFDTFTSYKETLFYGIKEAFGSNTILDIYFHHFNFEVFRSTIANHIGNYTSYIVIPMEHRNVSSALQTIPEEKLYLLDIKPKDLKIPFCGIYQDFEFDMLITLDSIRDRIKKYQRLHLIFRNTITEVPEGLCNGFVRYCTDQGINHKITTEKASSKLKKGNGFIVIDDEDLVTIVESAQQSGYQIGKDIGVISYNDTPLKKVVANGISVISTDFREMGIGIADMIQTQKRHSQQNNTTFIDRGSF